MHVLLYASVFAQENKNLNCIEFETHFYSTCIRQWENTYESMSEFVVPRSSRLVPVICSCLLLAQLTNQPVVTTVQL